jgi:haloalkane dehalogenase
MIPVLADAGHRVIAMDHLGMGRSDKPIDPDYYTYVDHTYRLETFIQKLELEKGKLTLFAQDWGSLIGLYVVGTHPDWFDRIVIGNGFLPAFAENTIPAPLPVNPTLTRDFYHTMITTIPAQQPPFYDDEGNLMTSLPEVVGFDQYLSSNGSLAEGGMDSGFCIWIDYSRNDKRFRPEQIVEALTYFDLSPEEEAAYAAPFPTRISMGGPRAFPGLVNQMPGLTQEAWDTLGTFDKPFLTIWGGNDPGNLGQPTTQSALINHVPGTAGWDHVRLPEASHFLQDDQGEEIARRINEFIIASNNTLDSPTAEQETLRVGFEILEMLSPNSIRAWISSDITQEEFDALELPVGWFKNQPREGDPDTSRFIRSPEATTEGELLEEELFSFNWWHSATVIQSNISLDEQGLLIGSIVHKYHEITYNAGTTITVLFSPDGDPYVRIGRDANRSSDTPTIPDSWQLVEYTTPVQLVIRLPEETTVIRADNQDSFQGPVPELAVAR